MSKKLMIQGTGSSVGKSIIVTALCRIFLQDGYKVCPFKAQNMSLNSFVTSENGEMGRAQVVQSQSCKIKPCVDMNPILIKPTSDIGAQIIVRGKSIGIMKTSVYKNHKKKILKDVYNSFDRLKSQYEIIVIEGAGSPAEINLKKDDIVNMKMAKYANSPVILVGDIDKGGVFASLIGTLELLSKKEQEMIKGFIINKFRGDKSLLKDGLKFLERRTKKPVLGVIPYFRNIRIPEEDSVVLDNKKQNFSRKIIQVNVIKLPYISNFTDFDVLENEPDVSLNYIDKKEDLNNSDILIIPGTKNTIHDLLWLKKTGLADQILSIIDSKPSTILIGICGGFQMLGNKIYDLQRIESKQREIKGLNVLPITTNFRKKKVLAQIKAKEISSGLEINGYEIHHGITFQNCLPVFEIIERQGKKNKDFDGAISDDGKIWGTYLHGVFDNFEFRRNFLNKIRIKKGDNELLLKNEFDIQTEFDKLANLVRKNMNIKLLYKILNDES